ncbi:MULTISPECIES: MaoC family dehydratase N-terminal domain-containing protein [unclassified Nocardiopsis]|uniref:FAS1-like dehydratase domain-containing protein n=1 Tax=unclassified Nocardiopsis TaxID=2649073 RepID=UPI0013574CF2|nr:MULTISPECIES: MaoC family dehydratase N-terminal domain-containing protein [unclassified Nocardiopsis]
MSLNDALVGRVYRSGDTYEVGREKIREFREAVGAPEGDEAPPTFPIVLAMRAQEAAVLDPELGFDFSRVIHRDQSFRHVRPARPGDVLTAEVRLTRVETLGANDLVALRSDIRTTAGEAVCTATTTLITWAETP